MLGYFWLVAIIVASVTKADDGPTVVSDKKDECVSQMIEWCNNMQYPQEGAGMSMVSIRYNQLGRHYRVFCASDSEGTNCTRNRTPWFYCAPDHTFSYKGQPVSLSDGEKVDDEICMTADKAFNDLFVQNMSYDNTTIKTEVERGMESFFQQMATMEQQIKSIQESLKNMPMFTRSIWNIFDIGFPFGQPNNTDDAPVDSKNDSNQIERE